MDYEHNDFIKLVSGTVAFSLFFVALCVCTLVFIPAEKPVENTVASENANEEFLAEFRDWLKKLEDKNSFAIIIPFAENASATQEQKEIFTASFKHCARRIKDCENVIGFSVPENVEPDFFISELKAKHGHYIFFSTDENLLASDEKIAKL